MEEAKKLSKKTITWSLIVLVVVVLAVVLYFWKSSVKKQTANLGVGNMPASQTAPVLQTSADAIGLTRQAIDSRDSSLCNQIEDANAKQGCLNNVIITRASDAKDPTICNALSDAYTKTACIDNILIVKARDAKDPSLCLTLQEKSRIADCESTAK